MINIGFKITHHFNQNIAKGAITVLKTHYQISKCY